MSGVSREKGGRLEENGGKAEITEQLRVPPLTTIKEEKQKVTSKSNPRRDQWYL